MQAPQAGEPDIEFGIGESRISQIGERTIRKERKDMGGGDLQGMYEINNFLSPHVGF